MHRNEEQPEDEYEQRVLGYEDVRARWDHLDWIRLGLFHQYEGFQDRGDERAYGGMGDPGSRERYTIANLGDRDAEEKLCGIMWPKQGEGSPVTV
ncbi:hypothetical protein LTR56_014197 [Elasticomyces elasticus]|nr:hypothetical protein LTR56_014197 [Elasticomyces elasticus]KAK3645253.1 hypothetical protein LTR22_014831 [Elasticomyces elasticus]KAK4917362.1 hypothetical protein LTR49_014716 [Elasticomyces elasticus]KAK5755096.1 hypothetical protein LTS12_014779 [Elasticomyces elasticus]